MPNILYFVFISECVESVLQFGRFFSSRKFGRIFIPDFFNLLRCGWLESQIATLHRSSGSLSSKGRGCFHGWFGDEESPQKFGFIDVMFLLFKGRVFSGSSR